MAKYYPSFWEKLSFSSISASVGQFSSIYSYTNFVPFSKTKHLLVLPHALFNHMTSRLQPLVGKKCEFVDSPRSLFLFSGCTRTPQALSSISEGMRVSGKVKVMLFAFSFLFFFYLMVSLLFHPNSRVGFDLGPIMFIIYSLFLI